jgi:hypothetical protein
MTKSHLIYELVDGPLPLEKDLVEAAERAGIRNVASIWDRHVDSSSPLERLYIDRYRFALLVKRRYFEHFPYN